MKKVLLERAVKTMKKATLHKGRVAKSKTLFECHLHYSYIVWSTLPNLNLAQRQRLQIRTKRPKGKDLKEMVEKLPKRPTMTTVPSLCSLQVDIMWILSVIQIIMRRSKILIAPLLVGLNLLGFMLLCPLFHIYIASSLEML